MMHFTPESIMAMKPCSAYTPERLVELFDGRDSMTHNELAALETVPAEDRVWVFLQTEYAHAIVERIFTRAVTNHALHCGIPEVETWAQGWLDGTDRSEAAADAARAAARSAARARADGTGRSVSAAEAAEAWAWAWPVARADAARAAARVASRAAAWAAARSAAWESGARAAEAERKLQLADCVEVIDAAEKL